MLLKIIRKILGWIILTLDGITRPRPIERSAAAQSEVNRRVASLAIYQLEACPFCVRVRRVARRLNLPIPYITVDGRRELQQELLKGGGQFQVPCLRITESAGNVKWLYESSAIISYLEREFGAAGVPGETKLA